MCEKPLTAWQFWVFPYERQSRLLPSGNGGRTMLVANIGTRILLHWGPVGIYCCWRGAQLEILDN
jgi:hypothetical protein